jgi:hypothetical protein
MKIYELGEGVGRITKQNQTIDVGPNEIKTQAAKFGNKVDKDGRPPTLSKKVKGSKTNVLFNLGMAESEQPRYTAYEWALMEGGHSLDETPVSETYKDLFFYMGILDEKVDDKTKVNYKEFAKFVIDTLGIKTAPRITLTGKNLDRTFGYFDDEDNSITVSYDRRHQMDTMRTLAHELVHHKQREEKDDLNGNDGSPDENEANAMAGVLLRRWAEKNPQLFSEKVEIFK